MPSGAGNSAEAGAGRAALLVVDVQRDFLPGGALAVPRGDEIVGVLNDYIALARERGMPVLASRDWHPVRHCSFREQGGPWPPHCIAHTPGADFAPGLALPPDTIVVSKATREGADAYSAFAGTGLAERLRSMGIAGLLVGGLATDYCVLNTVRDALAAGFAVTLLTDAVRAVDVRPGDGARAEAEMRSAGAVPATLREYTP
jgi:nicotinamidase/pyrazinamidase